MIISYVSNYDDSVASTRYRMTIPGRVLARDHDVSIGGHPRMGADVCVFGKLWEDEMLRDIEIAHRESRVVLDLCDHHWGRTKHPELSHRYNVGPLFAHVITVPTPKMAEAVNRYVGRHAVVIPDPYEFPEAPPKQSFDAQKVMWFGSETNLPYLAEVMNEINTEVAIISGTRTELAKSMKVNPWSMQVMKAAFDICNTVIIPQRLDERTECKSNNRMLESIRSGLFVVASEHPAHEEFKKWMYIGNIKEGLEWARQNSRELPERIRAAQDYIRDKYSPEVIAMQWKAALQ